MNSVAMCLLSFLANPIGPVSFKLLLTAMDRTVFRALDRQLLILLAREDSDVSDSSGASRHSSMPPLIDATPLTRSRSDRCYYSEGAVDEWREQKRRCRHRATSL